MHLFRFLGSVNWRYSLLLVLGALVFTCAISCGEPSEAPRVRLPVVVDSSGLETVSTNLGYDVEITSARIVVEDLKFTVSGEVHAVSVWQTLADSLVPTAHAHPGHFQGGEVIGELRGEFVVEWPTDDGRELGTATLIAANYEGANFTFARGSTDVLEPDDPLAGNTAVISGTASRDSVTTTFTFVVVAPEGRELVGAPFEANIQPATSGSVRLRFDTLDEFEGDTLFDDIDFEELDSDADGVALIQPDSADHEDAYNTFRRTFLTHDHYSFRIQE